YITLYSKAFASCLLFQLFCSVLKFVQVTGGNSYLSTKFHEIFCHRFTKTAASSGNYYYFILQCSVTQHFICICHSVSSLFVDVLKYKLFDCICNACIINKKTGMKKAAQYELPFWLFLRGFGITISGIFALWAPNSVRATPNFTSFSF